jgi:hypothetical protein
MVIASSIRDRLRVSDFVFDARSSPRPAGWLNFVEARIAGYQPRKSLAPRVQGGGKRRGVIAAAQFGRVWRSPFRRLATFNQLSQAPRPGRIGSSRFKFLFEIAVRHVVKVRAQKSKNVGGQLIAAIASVRAVRRSRREGSGRPASDRGASARRRRPARRRMERAAGEAHADAVLADNRLCAQGAALVFR